MSACRLAVNRCSSVSKRDGDFGFGGDAFKVVPHIDDMITVMMMMLTSLIL